jgi:hypothetical protein
VKFAYARYSNTTVRPVIRGTMKVSGVQREEPDASLFAEALMELVRDQFAAEKGRPLGSRRCLRRTAEATRTTDLAAYAHSRACNPVPMACQTFKMNVDKHGSPGTIRTRSCEPGIGRCGSWEADVPGSQASTTSLRQATAC